MRILAIETSCDETAAAIVDNGRVVVAQALSSSENLHKETGGIIPERAARQQIKSITYILEKVLKEVKKDTLDAIAVTVGPGLIGSLLVGVETAKALSIVWGLPLIPVNHLHGHLFSSWIGTDSPPEFPLVGLVISGGHTDLVYMKDKDTLKWIGGTRDDAAGEAFDKTARIIGLPYPGGPAIAEAAKHFRDSHLDEKYNLFPRPMISSGDLDMSFSGLKTAVLNYTKSNQVDLVSPEINRLAAEIETAIIDVIVTKLVAAANQYKPLSVVVGGGVIANNELRRKLDDTFTKSFPNIKLFMPGIYNTDNAVMIAAAAFYTGRPKTLTNITALPELSIEKTA